MEYRIEELNIDEYRGRPFEVKYVTPGYYDLIKKELSFEFIYKEFDKPQVRGFKDSMCEPWLDNPRLFGAFYCEKLIGFIEINPETWNNRLRISNLFIEEEYRHYGIGSSLIKKIIDLGKENNIRQLILETQSCNVSAIACYMKNGFELVGLDAYSYSDEDILKHEVRMEFVYRYNK